MAQKYFVVVEQHCEEIAYSLSFNDCAMFTKTQKSYNLYSMKPKKNQQKTPSKVSNLKSRNDFFQKLSEKLPDAGLLIQMLWSASDINGFGFNHEAALD